MMENPKDQMELMDILIEAKEEWLQAQNYFENVSEPDLVDYAIYRLEAAKKRYAYLIKQARIQGVTNNRIISDIIDETSEIVN